ncbi:MAG: hypothetical protein JWO33_2417 [Caulobacteraceae bacterium]|nr:hypothetical protein [Caulobacteraceae bacterium]
MKRALAIALGAALLASPLVASAQPAKPGAFKVPRNLFGQPDLEGTWTNATITPQTRPANYGARLVHTPEEVKQLEGRAAQTVVAGNQNTDPNAPAPTQGVDPGGYNRGWLDPGSQVMRVHGEPRTSLLTTPDGLAPLNKQGQRVGQGGGRNVALGEAAPAAQIAAQAQRGQFDNPEQRPLGERCIVSFGRNGGPPMFGNGFYNNNYRFMQNRDEVTITVEMVHDVRHVRLGSRQHPPSNVRPWFGDSVGWYEGDSLVVETTNIPQRQAYMGAWRDLKVTERFTRVAKDRMLYQFTIDDPSVWANTWGGEYEFADLHGELHEYACHEGNYALEGILAGARADEAAQAGKRAAAN